MPRPWYLYVLSLVSSCVCVFYEYKIRVQLRDCTLLRGSVRRPQSQTRERDPHRQDEETGIDRRSRQAAPTAPRTARPPLNPSRGLRVPVRPVLLPSSPRVTDLPPHFRRHLTSRRTSLPLTPPLAPARTAPTRSSSSSPHPTPTSLLHHSPPAKREAAADRFVHRAEHATAPHTHTPLTDRPMAMGGASFPFQWPEADPGLDDVTLPPLPTAVPDAAGVAAAAYYADSAADMHAMPHMEALPDFAAALAAMRREEEEAAGIRLVHLLMSCAGAVEAGDHAGASAHLADAHAALAAVSPASGIGRVAVHFTAALSRRLFPPPTPSPPPPAPPAAEVAADHAFLYHRFYEAGPYLKFAHFTANQAILEAVQGCRHVHIIDFSLMQGLQWPALIQALALRPGGPPSLRLTGIGPPSPPGRDDLRDVGVRLADLARSVRVHFSFRGVAANRLDEVRPWMLQVAQGEAVAVNSVLQLHRLLADDASFSADDARPRAPIDAVLDCVASVRPKVLTVVEQEADHNKPGFLDRFTEALFYYSAVFDSLDAASGGAGDAAAEAYLEREICDIVCGEGADRRERHEPLWRWRDRLGRAGLAAVPLGANALRQARMLVGLFSGEGHCVEEAEGCLTLGWHGRPLFSASAWRAAEENNQSDSCNADGSRSSGSGSGSGSEESNISCSS